MDYLEDHMPAVAVLDLNLPGTSGTNVLARSCSDEQIATADERQAETLTNAADILLLKHVSPMLLRELTQRIRK